MVVKIALNLWQMYLLYFLAEIVASAIERMQDGSCRITLVLSNIFLRW